MFCSSLGNTLYVSAHPVALGAVNHVGGVVMHRFGTAHVLYNGGYNITLAFTMLHKAEGMTLK